MEKLTDLLENAESLYLDYFNNFITVQAFAEYYEIDNTTARLIIDLGRRKNHMKITNPHK